jgi:serine/threonine-protein kinase HipA
LADKLSIYVGRECAGDVERSGTAYRFAYSPTYAGPPVFLNLPVAMKEKSWDTFPPVLDGLLPEGVLLEQLLTTRKLDRSDKWGQLEAVGRDLTGFLTLVREGEVPGGMVPDVQIALKRTPRTKIKPGESSLPLPIRDLVTFHSKVSPRMSLSGVQPKVSAVFSRKRREFRLVQERGSYILKPSPQAYPDAAPTEALTMHLARQVGLDVPHCGLVHTSDQTPVFWIERFDRQGAGNQTRLRVEDFCQLLEVPSSWKYHGNLETLVRVVRDFTTNPILQLARLFERVVFNWVIGNGDMHLKNWSLMENGPLIELAPAYDFLNTAILMDEEEESALALKDQKSGWDTKHLIEGFGRDLCELNSSQIAHFMQKLPEVDWQKEIDESQLQSHLKSRYHDVVLARLRCLNLI